MQLCVALDLPLKKDNLNLVKELKELDIWLKVGLRSYIRDGNEFLYELKEINPDFKIFLDLKLYDIPNTMADSAQSIAELPIDMFNIHASSGKEAMKAVMQRLQGKKRPLVLAVTALTSFDEESFASVYGESIEKKANQFAKDSFECGLDGVVCSVHESKQIKEITSNSFITLTPGIRLEDSSTDDQKRVATPAVAKENLSDFIVVGRPIYNSPNPKKVTEKIISSIY
ncbi:MAG: orotidine-5-phosphate decarboxylase [Campylobacterota bacterium]|nr:orotidine-5-phosphate decarboxylase [Campylobacterota bacterium]